MRIQTLGAIAGGSESQWIYGNDRIDWSLKISEKLKMKLWERMSDDSEMEKVRILRVRLFGRLSTWACCYHKDGKVLGTEV